MHRLGSTSRRAFGLGLTATMFTATPALARQGVSPFGDATPVSGNGAASGWRIAEVIPLDLEGMPCALSPDGRWLAGIGTEREISLWSIPDLEQTLVPFPEAIEPDSFAWAPDGTAIAFSMDAFRLGTDSDIFVYDLATETLHNVTDDGYDGGFFSPDDAATPFHIDVMPAWTPDSQQLVFARTTPTDPGSLPTDIVRVSRTGGDVEVLTSIPDRPYSIFTPMAVLPDGSVVYTFGFSEVDDPMNGLWWLEPDGTTTQLFQGAAGDAFQVPIITGVWNGVDDTRIAGCSMFLLLDPARDQPAVFTWSSQTGTPEPLSGTRGIDPVTAVSATWTPDGSTLLVIGFDGDGQLAVETVGPVHDVTPLPSVNTESARGPRWTRPTWSQDGMAFVPAINGTPYLLTFEPGE